MWILLALGSAFLTAAVGTLTKAGTAKVEPGVALAVQATVLALCAWAVLALRGKLPEIGEVPAKTWPILLVAGVLTCAAFLLYYGALASGSSSAVQPVDRLSLVFAIGLAAVFLRERVNPAMLVGMGLMTVGAIVIALASPPAEGSGAKGEVRAVRDASAPPAPGDPS